MSPRPGAKDLRAAESAPSFGAVDQTPAQALARLEFFRELSEAELGRVAASAELIQLEQDRVVPRAGFEGEATAYYFVLRGQVAFAEFEQGKVPSGPINKKKRVEPVMQVAHRIVSFFDVGEFFTNEHVEKARGSDGNKYDMGLFTCMNVVAVKLPKAAVDAALANLPSVRSAVELKAEEAYYRQTLLKLEDRADILDFYFKQGFEYAHAIKVIQSDKCIDCDECVKACEDRHGISRIERFGPRLGLIQFTLNCRSCADARCISECNFDAIGYDENAPEPEVIVYDNCVGCTKCAKACPHEAIRMVDIKEEVPDLVQLAKGKDPKQKQGTMIAPGEEEAPKKKKAKRVANKCDHCFGYKDMACITACPTGAIIQIDPATLFRRDGGYVERADKYFEPAPFERGFAQTTRLQGVRLMYGLFALATLFVLACTWEWIARRWVPDASLLRMTVGALQGPLAAKTVQLTYTAVSGMGRWMGYLGGGMMVISALYTLRLNLPGLRRIGNSRTWFDFHVVFGLAGPALTLLHTDLQIFSPLDRPLVTSLWWATVAIVLSGVVGRFLYTAIPRFEASADRERRRLDEGIQQVADQWAAMTMSANVLAQFLKAQEKAQQSGAPDAEDMGVVGFLVAMFKAEVERFKAEAQLRTKTMGGMKNKKLRKTTIKLMSARAVIERRVQLYGLAKRLLAQWRGIHIGISIFMFVLLFAHVAISVYAMGW
ncbi:MAG: 4Fe-4S dicluster domain-containing protein [Myxococcales bacterium]|nr:4Fe-4S dicluster domain-containing protein [Myxococcales bacterium]